MEIKQRNSAQFADEIGVKRSALSHVLSGRNNPSLDFMLKIKLRYPDTNLDWLLIGTGAMMEQTKIASPIQNKNDLFVQENELVEIDGPVENEKPTEEFLSQSENQKVGEVNAKKTKRQKVPVKVILLFSDSTFQIFDSLPGNLE
jgi:transcriptional regulator with XRE-family HTH domain